MQIKLQMYLDFMGVHLIYSDSVSDLVLNISFFASELVHRCHWINPSLVLGVLGEWFHLFCCILQENSCKSALLTLIRCRVLRRLN